MTVINSLINLTPVRPPLLTTQVTTLFFPRRQRRYLGKGEEGSSGQKRREEKSLSFFCFMGGPDSLGRAKRQKWERERVKKFFAAPAARTEERDLFSRSISLHVRHLPRLRTNLEPLDTKEGRVWEISLFAAAISELLQSRSWRANIWERTDFRAGRRQLNNDSSLRFLMSDVRRREKRGHKVTPPPRLREKLGKQELLPPQRHGSTCTKAAVPPLLSRRKGLCKHWNHLSGVI